VRHTIVIHRPGSAPEQRAVDRSVTAGGSEADGIFLPGSPPGALRLQPCAAGLVVEAGASGLRAGGHPVSPGTRRLVRRGEHVELHGATVSLLAADLDEGTRAAAGALLGDAVLGQLAPGGVHLVVLTGPGAGRRHALGGDQVVGRGRAAEIRLADAQASRRHARLRVGKEGATIEDLGSKNGILVNGVRAERRVVPLRPGDELVVGGTALAIEDEWPSRTVAVEVGPAPATPSPDASPRRLPERGVAAALLAVAAAALALAS
jgi:hypothetical protein